MRASVALADPRRLAAQLAQIVKLRTANAATLHHINVVHDGCMERKDPFDTDAKAGFADRDRFSHTSVLARDTDAFERLKSFFGLRFFDADVDPHGITGLKVRDVSSQQRFFNII